MEVWGSKWGVSGSFQRRKYSKIYSGLIRHHPGSILIYKIIVLKKNHRKSEKKSRKIDKNPSLLSALAGAMVCFSTKIIVSAPKPLFQCQNNPAPEFGTGEPQGDVT